MKFNFVLTALSLTVFAAICSAQDFSADVVYLPGKSAAHSAANPDHSPSKIYVRGSELRLETHGTSDRILLVNGDDQTAFVLDPAKKEYELLAGRISEYFRVKDPENACADWQNSAEEKIACEKTGHEKVDGRDTVKYENKRGADVAATAVWIDVETRFVTKWESLGIGVELRNIHEAPQTAELFMVPSSYDAAKPKKGGKGFRRDRSK